MVLYRCSHALYNCFWNISKPLWVGVLSDWVWFPPQTSTLVCVGKKPHQSISPLRCGPLVEPRQEPLQDTTLGIQYYFQIFPDFIQLNSAETPVLPFTQKNISNQYQIRNTLKQLQMLWALVFHCPAPAWIFPDFLEFFLHVLQVLHVLLVMIPFKEALRFLLRKRFTLEDYRWRSPRSRFDFFLTVLRSLKSLVTDCRLRSAESEVKRGAELNPIRQVHHSWLITRLTDWLTDW